MEKDKKLLIALTLAFVAIFSLSYGTGYFLGKKAGIKEEKEKCEIEKKQIIKTFATLTPVSRPQPEIEEKVVPPPQIPTEVQAQEPQMEENSNSTPTSGNTTNKNKKQSLALKLSENQKETGKGEKGETETPKEKENKTKETMKKTVKEAKSKENGKLYYLQVGVFKNQSNAVKLVKRLKEKGIKAKVLFESKRARVIVGFFKNLKEAQEAKSKLKKEGFETILKWRKS